jgi:hypothetical protein
MQKETNDPKEKSVVEICIIRSNEVVKLKKTLVAFDSANTLMLKCSKRFASEDKLKDLRNEIKNTIDELQMSMALLMKPIVAAHGITMEHKYWLSADEIRNGYVLLRKPNSLGATHVLFLRDHVDTFDGSSVKEGEIKLYKHVNHFLERIDASNELRKEQTKSKKEIVPNEKNS